MIEIELRENKEQHGQRDVTIAQKKGNQQRQKRALNTVSAALSQSVSQSIGEQKLKIKTKNMKMVIIWCFALICLGSNLSEGRDVCAAIKA